MSEGTQKITNYFIRMNSGEDLISQVIVNTDKGTYTFRNPFKVVYTISPEQGGLAVSLIEWVFPTLCVGQDFNVYADDVITMAAPSEILEKYYTKVVDKMLNDERYKVIYPQQQMDSMTPDEQVQAVIDKIKEVSSTSKKRLH